LFHQPSRRHSDVAAFFTNPDGAAPMSRLSALNAVVSAASHMHLRIALLLVSPTLARAAPMSRLFSPTLTAPLRCRG